MAVRRVPRRQQALSLTPGAGTTRATCFLWVQQLLLPDEGTRGIERERVEGLMLYDEGRVGRLLEAPGAGARDVLPGS